MGRQTTVVAAVLCLCLVGAQGVEAQFGRNKVHYDRLDFRVLQTEHFDVYYYAEKEEAARHAGRLAERWYARFSELFGHVFTRRQPLVLYASHPHFSQTNLTPGTPGEGTGGFIEAAKSRIVMPFAAGLGETDHVLGHEIAHAFQIELTRSVRQNAFALPGWFIEGMAEYLSLGAATPHTMMWLRDAALHDQLPTIEQLDDPRFFPYRYGHALWSYLAGRFGDQLIGRVLRSQARGVEGRLEEATGLSVRELTADWHASIPVGTAEGARVPPVSIGRDDPRTRIHVAPAIAPDGDRVMFISERDRLSVDLFMASATDGQVIRKIVSTAAREHFDSLQYIHSAGAWDAEGRRFAMTALQGGEPVLVVLDTIGDARPLEIRLGELSEIYNPSWAPDGTRIVFSALRGGFSDLYIYDLEHGALDQLTADAFADLHPAWSPDGRTIAVATDRFTTDLETLRFGALRIGLIDLESGVVRPLTPGAGYGVALYGDAPAPDPAAAGRLPYGPLRTKQVSPQWAPGGDAMYFVSDPDGVSNIYRVDLATGDVWRVTAVTGGISGITASSPSLAVAGRSGTLAYSVYRKGRYAIDILEAADALDGAVPVSPVASHGDEPAFDVEEPRIAAALPAVAEPAVAEPADAVPTDALADAIDGGLKRRALAELLADAEHGLPDADAFSTRPYDDRLRLESFAQPYIGASTGGSFGGTLRASFGLNFGDMLKDRQLQTLFRVGTKLDDFAAQIAYVNRKERWNWGFAAGFVPSRFYGARRTIEREGELVTRETAHLRYLHQWGGVLAQYNINRSRRLEVSAGVRRTGFAWQTVTRVLDPALRKEVSRALEETSAGQAVHLVEAQMAFVHDTAVFGPTSPVLGQRLRLEVEPAMGGLSYTDVRVDARRYFMPVRPITLAARVEHAGRYGHSASDPRLTPLVVGLQSLVRGYDLTTFAANECGRQATECSLLEELRGSRLALLNLEVRAPLFGLFSGDFDYGPIPIEAIAFVDMGFLWTQGDAAAQRHRFRSVGAGARANVGGLIFEGTAARPFDRSDKGWTFSLLLRPGW